MSKKGWNRFLQIVGYGKDNQRYDEELEIQAKIDAQDLKRKKENNEVDMNLYLTTFGVGVAGIILVVIAWKSF